MAWTTVGKEEVTAVTFEARCLSTVFESLVSHPHHTWLCIMHVLYTNSVITWMITLPGVSSLCCESADSQGCTVFRKITCYLLPVLEEWNIGPLERSGREPDTQPDAQRYLTTFSSCKSIARHRGCCPVGCVCRVFGTRALVLVCIYRARGFELVLQG